VWDNIQPVLYLRYLKLLSYFVHYDSFKIKYKKEIKLDSFSHTPDCPIMSGEQLHINYMQLINILGKPKILLIEKSYQELLLHNLTQEFVNDRGYHMRISPDKLYIKISNHVKCAKN
jgi:hypothetical protein